MVLRWARAKTWSCPPRGTVKVTAKVAAFLEEQPDEAIRKLSYDKKPYWDVERARIGNSRKVPLEVVVNGRVVAGRKSRLTESCEMSRSMFPWSEAVGSVCGFFPHRTPILFG